MNRKNFLFIGVPLFILLTALPYLGNYINFIPKGTLIIIFGILACTILLCVLSIQRLNDIGISRLYALFIFIPFVNLLFFIYLLFKKVGTKTVTENAENIDPGHSVPNQRIKKLFGDMKWLLYFSACLFIGSLFLPGFVTPDQGAWPGYMILAFGYIGIFLFVFAWFANIFGFVAFIFALTKQYKVALFLAVVAVLVALDAYGFHSIPGDDGSEPVSYLGIGFYIWIVSFLILAVYSFIKVYRQEKLFNKAS